MLLVAFIALVLLGALAMSVYNLLTAARLDVWFFKAAAHKASQWEGQVVTPRDIQARLASANA